MLLEWLRGAGIPPCFPDILKDLRDDVIELILSKSSQSIFLCILFAYHLLLLWLNARRRNHRLMHGQRWYHALLIGDWCKLLLVLSAVSSYMVEWQTIPLVGDKELFIFGIDQSTNVLVFLLGIVFGQFVEALVPRNTKIRLSFGQLNLITLLVILSLASLAANNWAYQFKYRGEIRATGLWVNPNTFGLLMGVGLVFALAALIQAVKFALEGLHYLPSAGANGLQSGERKFEKSRIALLVGVCALGAAAIILAIGLFRSYSRGAWLSTLVGGAFIVSTIPRLIIRHPVCWFGFKYVNLAWLRREKWIITIAGCSIIALILAYQPYMNHKFARRATSVVNANDFSSRNRLIACESGLQIMADHPIAGVGWHGVRSQFEYFYAPFITTDSWSIILNDYLTIGMAIGIPALTSFIVLMLVSWNGTARHKWLELRKPHLPPNQKATYHNNRRQLNQQEVYCGALIVLLVGFWFDGGLFKLALAIPFWLFLELINQSPAGADKCE